MYSPFSSKENLQSSEEVQDLQVIDTQPGHSIDVPLYSGDFNPINPILEEDAAELAESKKSEKGTGGGDGGATSGHKSKSDGGGNRLKRNIKHTGSLIVRKLTSARQGDTDKKGGAGASGKKEKEQQEAAGTDKEKPNSSKPEGKVAMLRTTTL